MSGGGVKRKYGKAEFQEKRTQKTTLPPVPNFNWKMIKANQGHVISMCNLCFVKNKILKWTYALLREPAQPFNCNSQTCCELVPGCQIEPQPRFIVDLWTRLYPPAWCWHSLFFFFFPLRAVGLCVFVVGVHSSSCGLCEDIGGCYADSHGKGSSWSYSFGLWVFLFALAELRGWVHGPAACIQLVTQSCFSKTNFMAVSEAALRKN